MALCSFNGGAYVDEQLQSIAEQGELIAEIVVADDGSSDDTLERIAAFAEGLRAAGSAIEVRVLGGAGGNAISTRGPRLADACQDRV